MQSLQETAKNGVEKDDDLSSPSKMILARLTAREREVLAEIADGWSNKEVADRLDVGIRTVETHREKIMRKLDIHKVAGLVKFAVVNGLTDPEPRELRDKLERLKIMGVNPHK